MKKLLLLVALIASPAWAQKKDQLPERSEADILKTVTLPEGYEATVFAKPPFGGPNQVLEYLGRYTHRVAISNQRLVSVQQDKVSFQWKDYLAGEGINVAELNVTEPAFFKELNARLGATPLAPISAD